MLQIVYELAWYWLGDRYLDDPYAARIRTAMWDDELDYEAWSTRHALHGTLGFYAESDRPIPVWTDILNVPQHHHAAILLSASSQVIIAVRIFNLFEAVMVISEDSSYYTNRLDPLIVLDPEQRCSHETFLPDHLGSHVTKPSWFHSSLGENSPP